MRLNKFIQICLIFLLLFSVFVRFYKLNTVPPHLSNDEISIAYDAYSISGNQKDEHNKHLPIAFESHGTYKAPGYLYILSPLYLFLPNTNLTPKLPSVIFGFLTIFVIFGITLLLTNNKIISMISAIILLSCPWHITVSRMVLESNLALFFLSLGLLISLFSIIKKKDKYLFLSIVPFTISMYCYHTEWGLAPILFLILLVFFRKNKKCLVRCAFLFLLLTLPLLINYLDNIHTSARANTEIIWKEESTASLIKNSPKILTPFIVSKAFLEKYFEYTNVDYLFFNGSELLGSKNIFEQGLFLWPLIIPFFYGFFFLRKYIKKPFLSFFIIWTLISPLIPSLTHGSPSLIRNLNSVIPYTIIISIGLFEIFRKFKYLSMVLSCLILISSFYFGSIYLFHYPLEKAEGFQGYYPITEFLKRDSQKYNHIYIDYKFGSSCQYIGVPHLYLAYYQKFNPEILQNRTRDSFGMDFDKYTVTQIDWNDIDFHSRDLYIVSICNQPVPRILDKIKLVTKFTDQAGNPAFELWEAK